MFPNHLDGAKVLFYSQKDDFGKVNYIANDINICTFEMYLDSIFEE